VGQEATLGDEFFRLLGRIDNQNFDTAFCGFKPQPKFLDRRENGRKKIRCGASGGGGHLGCFDAAGDQTSQTFGTYTAANPSRRMVLAMKLYFRGEAHA
jgi:hypothetical protein